VDFQIRTDPTAVQVDYSRCTRDCGDLYSRLYARKSSSIRPAIIEERQVSGDPSSTIPSDVSLQVFVERIILEMDRRYEQRFEAQQRATILALQETRSALDIALASTKEISTMAMQAHKVLAEKAEQFADQKLQTHNQIRPWVEMQIKMVSDRLSVAERAIASFQDREKGIGLSTKIILGGISLFLTLLTIYLALKKV